MTSPWYNPTKLVANTRALAENLNNEFAKIQAAFNQLPPPGSVGTGAQAVYTHFAYADSADGTLNFTTGTPGTRSYIGVQANSANLSPSQFPSDYNWSRIGAVSQDDLTLELNDVQADAAQALLDAATAISNAATAQATADGKVTTFFQDSPPLAEGEGDLWVDTNDGNRLYRWNGTAWSEIRDAGIGQAITAASDAQSTADGKIVSFYQASEPTAGAVGDLWFDTDDSNKVRRWSGSAWLDARDAGIALAQQQAADAAADAAAAQADADAANDAIAAISLDSVLSADEKPEIRKQRDAIIGEYSTIRTRALAFGVSTTTYEARYSTLITYLGTLALDTASNTNITRATFNTRFVDYYNARQIVLDGIADAAALSGPAGANLVSIADHTKIPNNWVGLAALSTDVPSAAPPGDRSYEWNDGARQTSPIIAGASLGRKFFVSGWMSTAGHTGGPVTILPRNVSDGAPTARALLSGNPTLPANTGWTYLSAVYEITENVNGIIPGLDLAANGGVSPKVWGMTWIELSPGIEAIVPPNGANRVPLSRMEQGRGWLSLGSMPIATGIRPVKDNASGTVFIRADHQATGAQSFGIRNAIEPGIPVFPGERLSVSALISVSNSSSWRFDLEFYDDDDILVSAERLGGVGSGAVNNQTFSKFVTVPAGAVTARFFLLVISGGAGAFWAHIANPMVTGAAPGQTTHPPYTPGPNADDGSDVTANAQVLASQPTPFEIQADSAGVTTSDLSTIERTISITKGGVGQTSGVSVGTVTRSPSSEITVATPTVSGGIVTVKLTKADAAGSITVPVIFEGKTYRVTIDVRRTLAAPSPGAANDSFNDQTWANKSGTSFNQVAGDETCMSNGSGVIELRYAASYTGGTGRCKIEYRPDSGGTWALVPGSDRMGSTPIPPQGWPEPEPGEPGVISYGWANLTGLAPNTRYRFRLMALSVTGALVSWSSPVFAGREP